MKIPKHGHLKDNFPEQNKRLRELSGEIMDTYAKLEALYNELADLDPDHAESYRLMAKPYGELLRLAMHTP